ncbi:MAG: hypothetical protein AAFV43_16950 [Planctomycetota bacterium]
MHQLSSGGENGVAPVEYKVTVNATQLIPPSEPGGTQGGRRISPIRYATPGTSGLQFTVEPGRNELDLQLTTDET